MNKIKKYSGVFFEAVHPFGSGNLSIGAYTDDDTLNGVKYAIDEANLRAISKGYKAEQFLIVEHTWENFYDENKMFLMGNESRRAIEMYPHD